MNKYMVDDVLIDSGHDFKRIVLSVNESDYTLSCTNMNCSGHKYNKCWSPSYWDENIIESNGYSLFLERAGSKDARKNGCICPVRMNKYSPGDQYVLIECDYHAPIQELEPALYNLTLISVE